MILFINIHIDACTAVNAYCEEHSIEKSEFYNKIAEEFGDRFNASEVFTDEEIKQLECNTSRKIFSNAKKYLTANNTANLDYLKQVQFNALQALLIAGLVADSSLPSKETNPEVRCERLKIVAEIKSYILTALIYPNGKAMSLYLGDRSGDIEKLKSIYSEIQELDPTFVTPTLPSTEGIVPNTNSSSDGSCYVATAVYGSYDCPQVWTLRRFRDYTLAETWYGRAFIHTYYAISPTLVKWFGNTEWFKSLWKPKLDKMVKKLNTNGIENTPYKDRNW